MTTREFARSSSKPAAGDILLSHNHIALLHGLYDRPNGTAVSRVDWVKAAAPYAERMTPGWSSWCLRKSMVTIPSECVKQEKRGRYIEASLTNAGRAILERNLAARVRGRGDYGGLASVEARMMVAQRSTLADGLIRKAVEYAKAYGLPLLESNPSKREAGRVFAVTTGLDKPFRIMCLEELEQRGPRAWHWEWTREMIDAGHVPPAYLAEFREHDYDDVLCHLKELRENEADFATYMKVYTGSSLLSLEKATMFLNEQIDFESTDMNSWHIGQQVRRRSVAYKKALIASRTQSAWVHPDTGTLIGNVFRKNTDFSTDDIVVSSCAALSCLQHEWDQKEIGLHIETRYIEP